MRQTDIDGPDGGATTRERITDYLRTNTATASALATEFEISPQSALTHVRHAARSLSNTEERLLVGPPKCRDCGFDGFEDPANLPSRCPSCKSEAVSEPVFTVE